MPRLVGLSRQVWVPGTYFRGFNPPSDPFVIVPEGSEAIMFLAERNAWDELPGDVPDNEVLRVRVELSMDEGETWSQPRKIARPDGGFDITPTNIFAGFKGGIRIDIQGNEITHASLGPLPLPEPTNEDRRARITMEVRTMLNTQIDIDFLP